MTRNKYSNVTVEWLVLLRRIREVPGSNSARRQATLNQISRGFPQYRQENPWLVF
jgi:hypothetical protein